MGHAQAVFRTMSPVSFHASPVPRPRRLAIVLSHPTQYYSPWFAWIAAHVPLDLRVFYLWDFGVTAQRDPQFGTTVTWDVDLLSGYPHEFVPNRSSDPGTHRFSGLVNPALPERLAVWQPDVILLFGYNYASHLRTVWWARTRRVPLIFRGDSHFLGRATPGRLKRLLLRVLYRQFAAITSVGRANRDYFLRLGVPPSRLHFAPHSVDATRFDPGRLDHVEAAARLRHHLGLAPEIRVVLFAGKLVAAKQPRALLTAYLATPRSGTALVFVGEGDEKAALQAQAAGAPDVHFLPFANQSEMPSRYLLADLFVLPSRGYYETWGLAVNEAMHLGVPALVSDRVGCQRDLVSHGETGWVFAATDPTALAPCLAAALADLALTERRERIRRSVLARIAGYTYARTTAGLLDALASLPPPHSPP